MTAAEILTYGKWVLFFGIPMALGAYELWRLRRAAPEDEPPGG